MIKKIGNKETSNRMYSPIKLEILKKQDTMIKRATILNTRDEERFSQLIASKLTQILQIVRIIREVEILSEKQA